MQFESEIFCIIAGPHQKRLSAHGHVLNQSPVLRKIVDGGWKDSHDRIICLDEWDEQSVQQLLEWLYCGHYTWYTDLFDPTPDEEDRIRFRSRTYVTSLGLTGDRIVHLSPRSCNEQQTLDEECLYHQSISENMCLPAEVIEYGIDSTPLQVLEAHHHSSGIEAALERMNGSLSTLLSDAKLYVLANYLQLPRLKRLAFVNLQHVIDKSLRPNEYDSPDLATIMDFIRYVYASTDSLSSYVEPLRRLVAAVVVTLLRDLRGAGIQELFREGGDMVVDVIQMMEDKAEALFNQEIAKARMRQPR